MTRLTLTVGTMLLAAQAATAQSVPNIMKPKQAAQRAASATNAQVAANSTLPEDSAQSPRAVQARPRSTVEALPIVNSAARPVAASLPAAAAPNAAPSDAVDRKAPYAVKAPGFERETFSYARVGRRDPFVSLLNTSQLRPLISDLKLVAVAFDAAGRNSVAILHDLGTKDQYRVRPGQSLGRMRVSAITTRSVVFTIEEFGYSRRETLALGDSNKVRKQ